MEISWVHQISQTSISKFFLCRIFMVGVFCSARCCKLLLLSLLHMGQRKFTIGCTYRFSIFLIQTVGTSRPLPSQRLSHLKQSSKPKSIRLHKTSLYRNTTHLAIQQTCHGNRSSTSFLFMLVRHLCCLRHN